jgi:biotin carboxyl carrier protein
MARTPEGRRALARVAEQILPALIARLSASELGELEVREGEWRVRLRRDPATAGTGRTSPASALERRAGSNRGTAGDRPAGPDREAATDRGAPSRSTAARRAILSPAVGYFMPRPDLAVGQPIRAGDVLGHVDVLGVPVDVVAPADGRLGRIYGASGEAVEYGQELLRIDGVESGATGVGLGDDGVGAVNLESIEADMDIGFETATAAMVD